MAMQPASTLATPPVPHFEVTARFARHVEVVFTCADEDEATGYAMSYALRHPLAAVTVSEERYDAAERVYRSRRIWTRLPTVSEPPRRQVVVTRSR